MTLFTAKLSQNIHTVGAARSTIVTRNSAAGFTLIEIAVVIVVLSLLLAMIAGLATAMIYWLLARPRSPGAA